MPTFYPVALDALPPWPHAQPLRQNVGPSKQSALYGEIKVETIPQAGGGRSFTLSPQQFFFGNVTRQEGRMGGDLPVGGNAELFLGACIVAQPGQHHVECKFADGRRRHLQQALRGRLQQERRPQVLLLRCTPCTRYPGRSLHPVPRPVLPLVPWPALHSVPWPALHSVPRPALKRKGGKVRHLELGLQESEVGIHVPHVLPPVHTAEVGQEQEKEGGE